MRGNSLCKVLRVWLGVSALTLKTFILLSKFQKYLFLCVILRIELLIPE